MNGLAAALTAGAAVLALGSAAAALRGGLRAGLALQAAGVGILGVCGLVALVGERTAGSAFHGGVDPALGVDGLTGFFLLALGLTALPALVYAQGYLAHGDARAARAVGALTGVFLLSLAGVVCARDPATLLLFWELMTLAPASAILAARRDDDVRRHVFAYLAITHLGGAGVWVAVLELARVGALDDPTALAGATSTQVLVGVAAVIGFGTKAGLMPFHTWLPRAHPIAPSHVSALMSGLMVKVALYGLIRVCFEWLGGTPVWLGVLLLALGGLSALGGVLYALFQRDLKRLLAFSSIENVGIVTLALGASLLLAERGDPVWAAVAFGGALLHVLAHGVFKGLLFLAAGAIDHAVHGLEIDRLGGLLRRMPWTGWTFAVGAIAIAGVPPLAGFPSEWLALQSLLHVATGGGVGLSVAGALGVTALGLTGALALFCFAKVIGLVLLGQPRRRACAVAQDPPVSMRAGMAVLAALCVVLGVVPGLLLPELAKLAPTALALPRHAGLELPGTGSLPGPAIAILLVVVGGALALLRGRRVATPAPHWACGQLVEPALAWTSAGFTKALRLMLEALLRPERRIETHVERGIVQEVEYAGEVPHHFETKLYRPLVRVSLAGAALARRLQSGSLGGYVAYLLALVVLVLILARAGALS